MKRFEKKETIEYHVMPDELDRILRGVSPQIAADLDRGLSFIQFSIDFDRDTRELDLYFVVMLSNCQDGGQDVRQYRIETRDLIKLIDPALLPGANEPANVGSEMERIRGEWVRLYERFWFYKPGYGCSRFESGKTALAN